MECRDEERMWVEEYIPVNHRTLLILAVAVLFLGAVALALTSIDAALETSSSFQMYQSGWSVGTMVFMLTDNAVYLPGVLLGLAGLGLAQSGTTRQRAAKMARPLLILGVVIVLLGIGRAVCEVGSDYSEHLGTLSWPTAQTVFRLLGRSLLQAGILAGLAYLCRQRVGSANPCQTNKLD